MIKDAFDYIGENCKRCLCHKCELRPKCGDMKGDTQQYCEEDCLGENSYLTLCKSFRPKKYLVK